MKEGRLAESKHSNTASIFMRKRALSQSSVAKGWETPAGTPCRNSDGNFFSPVPNGEDGDIIFLLLATDR